MIKFQNVHFSYADTAVFDNLNIEIADTGISAIIAPSGIGKTTLLRLIAGLEKPQSGEVLGVPERIAYVFQEQRLLPWYNAVQNIEAISPACSKDEILDLLLSLGLTDEMVNKHPGELSGGQRQRVCLARAFAYGGDVLLLDEPFTGLDCENREKVLIKVQEFAKTKPVVLVSHVKDDINIADYILNL